MTRSRDGYFEGRAARAKTGDCYWLVLDDGSTLPDPGSRAQPEGPHGPSRIVDPKTFRWTDDAWRGVTLRGQVVYEMHVGTFTPEGTWRAAAAQLAELARIGITLIEMMPVAEFPGDFGWGYDGVDFWAPTRLYGEPDDLRAFIDRAHAVGIGVILDVVYNHAGPDGNYLARFADEYFNPRHTTDWGDAINFDGDLCTPVREFVIENAAYWIDEYHFDGLRLDATQNIYDDSKDHILAALTRRAREAAGSRSIVVIGENEPQETRLIRPAAKGGYGIDALWNDDLHHTALVALTGQAEAYYTDYKGSAQEFVSAVKYGYLYQGQRYAWQKQRRGTASLDLEPAAYVAFLENHDQIANTARGERTHARSSPAKHRALTALLLLAPWTPMLFQGEEFGSSAPFFYFADHGPELARLVRQGRGKFLAQFPSAALDAVQKQLTAPDARATFERCKLDFGERERHAATYALHADLIALRKRDPVFSAQRRRGVDGAVLSPDAFVLRFFDDDAGDRLLVVNLGKDLILNPAPEPLLAPPRDAEWAMLWSSEEPRYGGIGARPPETEDGWHVGAESLIALSAEPRKERPTHD